MDIDNFYSDKFKNYEAPPADDEWSELEMSLSKQNFFRFSPRQFNVYYLGMIVLSLSLSTALGVHYLSSGNVHTPQKTIIHTNRIDTVYKTIHDTVLIRNIENSTKTINEKKSIKKTPKKEELQTDSLIEHIQNTSEIVDKTITKKDTTFVSKKEKTLKTITDSVSKSANKNFIIKEKDLIITDTVYQYKNKIRIRKRIK